MIAMLIELIDGLVHIAADVAANAQRTEAEMLARLKVVLAEAAGKVDARLAEIVADNKAADDGIAAAGPK